MLTYCILTDTQIFCLVRDKLSFEYFLAVEDTRVSLKGSSSAEQYINANFVHVRLRPLKVVQSPLGFDQKLIAA